MRGVAVLLVLLLAGCLGSPQGEPLATTDEPPAASPPRPSWATPEDAVIRPGMPIRTEKRDCPSNFVFTKTDNSSVFIGTTAYCVRDLPIGALATVGGPNELAILVYSSWDTMSENEESDPDAREYNDFAVFLIDASSRPRVSPALLEVGGPDGAADPSHVDLGARVRQHAQGPLTIAGKEPVTWREGVVTGKAGDWALLVHSPSPATPGYTGGAVVDAEGKALGIVVNIGVLPNPGANGVARLDALLDYAATHAKLPMVVATP